MKKVFRTYLGPLSFLVVTLVFVQGSYSGESKTRPDESAANGLLVGKKENRKQAKGKPAHGEHKTVVDVGTNEIDIDEKLGRKIPLELIFNDENGRQTSLMQMITKPTVLSLVFFSCRGSCPLLLGEVAIALSKLDLKPGKDYHALTVSFDPSDTPKLASQAKPNYVTAVGKPFPDDAWRFLTGNEQSIKALTEAVGFRFKKEGDAFSHPLCLIVLSPTGKITRYLYGTSFKPFDLAMALTEASEEKQGVSIKRALLYCFSYDKQEKKYVFNTLKVVGTATLVFVIALFVFLVVTTKKGKKKAL